MAGRMFVTGDCHSDLSKLNSKNFPMHKQLDKDDYVIICGDFGLVWDYRGENEYEKHTLNWLQNKSFTTLFVDGNHENFDRLYELPVSTWNGGQVHKIRNNVIHLMRGQVYNLAGKLVFAMGGASSHDIDDGILDPDDPDFELKRKHMDRMGALYRTDHRSWWKNELPSKEEYKTAVQNLNNAGNKVDYIISHCCATSTMSNLPGGEFYEADELTDFFECVKNEVSFDKWMFGHYHDNMQVSQNEFLLYEQIIELT